MAYTLQAFIGDARCFAEMDVVGASPQPLHDELAILHLSKPVADELGIGFLPLTDEGRESVPAISSLGIRLSGGGRVAYVEAEYFGGMGTQAACLFEKGRAIGQPTVSADAINRALRFLGVTAAPNVDEFDIVGLGRR